MVDSPSRSRSVARRNHALWIGPLLTFAGMVSYFQYFVRFPLLRDFPWVNLPAVLLGLGLSAWGLWQAFSRGSRWWLKLLGGLGTAFSLLIAGLFCAYVFSISYALPAAPSVVLEQGQAPEFVLRDHTGREVRLADFRGSRVVLVFYRGHW